MADDPQDAESELDTDDLDTDEQVDEEPVDDTDATTSKDTGDTKDTEDTGRSKASKGSKGSEEPTAPVVRKKVVSKRVTPKGGARPATAKAGAANRSTKRKADDDEEISFSSGRYTPPSSSSAQLPSPWWVPALMFGLLIVGALVIMLNYMELFGSAENYRLIIGLVLILGGIITATQYR